MIKQWRINRIKRRISILEGRLGNLNLLVNTNSYYVGKALSTADELSGLNFDLSKLENKE